jgi:hypothetical protein
MSVSRKCQIVCRDTKHKLRRRSEQYAEIKELRRKRKFRSMSEQYADIKAQNKKRKLRRRSELYEKIKDQKEKRKLRVRSLNSRPNMKLIVLIVSCYGHWSSE